MDASEIAILLSHVKSALENGDVTLMTTLRSHYRQATAAKEEAKTTVSCMPRYKHSDLYDPIIRYNLKTDEHKDTWPQRLFFYQSTAYAQFSVGAPAWSIAEWFRNMTLMSGIKFEFSMSWSCTGPGPTYLINNCRGVITYIRNYTLIEETAEQRADVDRLICTPAP